MGQSLDTLLDAIAKYNLDRFEEGEQILQLAELGRVSEHQARAYLIHLEDLIQQQIDFPNVLHRPPDPDELHADGSPDILLGEIENGTEFGLRIVDRPRHVLCAGTTGSGKTTCIRNIILRIEELNRESQQETNLTDRSG